MDEKQQQTRTSEFEAAEFAVLRVVLPGGNTFDVDVESGQTRINVDEVVKEKLGIA